MARSDRHKKKGLFSRDKTSRTNQVNPAVKDQAVLTLQKNPVYAVTPEMSAAKEPSAGWWDKEVKKGFAVGFLVFYAIVIAVALNIAGYFYWGIDTRATIDREIARVERQLKKDPDVLKYKNDLAYLYFEKYNLTKKDSYLDDAEKLFTEVLNKDKENGAAKYYLALIMENRQDYTKAIQKYRELLEKNPTDIYTRYGLALSLYKTKQYDEAISAIQSLTTPGTTNADALFLLGEIYEAKGDSKKALEMYTQALKFDPYNKDYKKGLERVSN